MPFSRESCNSCNTATAKRQSVLSKIRDQSSKCNEQSSVSRINLYSKFFTSFPNEGFVFPPSRGVKTGFQLLFGKTSIDTSGLTRDLFETARNEIV